MQTKGGFSLSVRQKALLLFVNVLLPSIETEWQERYRALR